MRCGKVIRLRQQREVLILGCPSRTCNEAVRGDMGLDSR